MSHERLKHMKENLISCIESQMCNIYEADAEELGEAVDMLKDLEEAIYYCTITEAMQKNETHHDYEERWPQMNYERSYNDGRTMANSGNYSNMGGHHGGSRSYMEDGHHMNNHETGHHDPKEGRSPEVRRMYMEARDMGKDKTYQIKELEHYMQELSADVVEMIQEAGTEEKQYLEKKLLALASKIGQMK
jgi:primosomal protein N''